MNRKSFCNFAIAVSLAATSTGCSALNVKGPSGPVSSDRVISIARMFENQNNYQKARQLYHTVLRSSPGHPQATELLANLENARVLGTMPGNPGTTNPFMQADAMMLAGMPQTSMPQTSMPQTSMPQTSGSVATARLSAPVPTQPAVVQQPVVQPTPTPAVAVATPATTQPVAETTPLPVQPATVPSGGGVPVQTASQSKVVPETTQTVTVEAEMPTGTFANPIEQPVTPAKTPAPAKKEVAKQPAPVKQTAGVVDSGAVTPADATTPSIEQYVDHPEQSVPQIIEFLDDAAPEVRSLAAFLIGETGWKGAAALPMLKQRLSQEQYPAIRLTAAESLAKIDPQSLDAFEVISECMLNDDAELRTHAALCMRVFAAAGHPECVQQLAQAMGDTSESVRTMAALSLGDFGSAAADAIPALKNALNDKSTDVRDAASASLARIDPTAK